jgi:hypothetical protein
LATNFEFLGSPFCQRTGKTDSQLMALRAAVTAPKEFCKLRE